MSALSFHGPGTTRRVSRLLVPGLLAVLVGGVLAGGTPAHGAVSPLVFVADLSGAAEDPPNASPATGSGRVVFDPVAHTMRVQFDFDGLMGDLTVAHIHACTAAPLSGNAAVATQTPTFVGTPAGTTSSSYDQTFDTTAASTYNPSYVTAQGGSVEAAETALLACLEFGGAYLNLHSTTVPSGEIRGFLLIDTDDDGTADAADLDDDGDGQADVDEIECGSDPLDAASTSPDADGDAIPDCADPTPDPTTTTAAPTTTVAPTTTTTTTPASGSPTTLPGAGPTSTAVAPSATLPATGNAGSGTAVGALALIVVGSWLVLSTRRPRRS